MNVLFIGGVLNGKQLALPRNMRWYKARIFRMTTGDDRSSRIELDIYQLVPIGDNAALGCYHETELSQRIA